MTTTSDNLCQSSSSSLPRPRLKRLNFQVLLSTKLVPAKTVRSALG